MVTLIGFSRYKINKKNVVSFINTYLQGRGITPQYNLNVVFVGRRKMRSVASTYKHEDVALPVLSFSYLDTVERDEDKLMGEVILCFPQVVLLAAERQKRVEELLHELIVHGIDNILK